VGYPIEDGDEYVIDGDAYRVVPKRTPDGRLYDVLDASGDPVLSDLSEAPDVERLHQLLDDARSRAVTIDHLVDEREY
jgi:hypothetical protein